ncbi:peptidoglycan DD-metalloendopeptidase family protein [Bacillus sp. 123MFChir2]|uniref:peptidoglycan DD-metalloendopeptidase family protein n=1 Tax=Bacillus sp. 123MFChir2 TaxID=1169144 RepID=UPI000372687D|nr:peptidoglycan DD-metalloendopeptidase family protein [Bacillus sp. 123MFChir2]
MKALKSILFFFCIFFIGQAESIAEEKQWTWPVEGRISDYFGTRNGKHFGIDIAAPIGTSIVAMHDGVVTRSYFSDSYGHVVFIKHRDYEAVYAHMNKRLVREGAEILQGQIIGQVGNTGHSNGAHLHLETHKGSWTIAKTYAVNPLQILGEKQNTVASASVYVVQTGDTLLSIARKFGTTVGELKVKNRLQKDNIYPSQKLHIN